MLESPGSKSPMGAQGTIMPLVYTVYTTLRSNPGIVSRVNSLKFGNRSKSTNFPKRILNTQILLMLN